MCIFSRIEEAAGDFTKATGKRPASVYLGHREMAYIKLDDHTLYQEIVRGCGQMRVDVCGLSAYLVNRESHLGVGT